VGYDKSILHQTSVGLEWMRKETLQSEHGTVFAPLLVQFNKENKTKLKYRNHFTNANHYIWTNIDPHEQYQQLDRQKMIITAPRTKGRFFSFFSGSYGCRRIE
jgi:hypothetical protein